MPNWCHNKLAVSGEPAAVAAFIEKVDGLDIAGDPTPLAFNVHVPEPEDIEGHVPPADSLWARIGAPGWLAWRMEYWGSKWDAKTDGSTGTVLGTERAVVDGHGSRWAVMGGDATIGFLTANSPPYPWLKAVGLQEPHLAFVLRWAEPGNSAAGELRVKGDQVEELDLEVDDVLSPEEVWF